MPPGPPGKRATTLHREALIINALDYTYERNFTTGYVDLLQAGGIDATVITAATPEDDARQAIAGSLTWRRRLAGLAERVVVATHAGDILRAPRDKKVAVILGLQNAKPIAEDLRLIEVFHRLGLRVIQLTYNLGNGFGSGVLDRQDDGLTATGREAVGALNRAGIVIDLSHAGERTALDAAAMSDMPVIVSHTAARALCGHFRCVSDHVIRAVASRGGCVGIAALSVFLREDGITAGSHLDDYLNHVEHMSEVGGIDHVGIGFDMGYGLTEDDLKHVRTIYPDFALPPMHLQYVAELNRIDKVVSLTAGLLDTGYSEDDVKKILGLNWYRIFARTWGEQPHAFAMS